MSEKLISVTLFAILIGGSCIAQTDKSAIASHPSLLNINCQWYPRTNSLVLNAAVGPFAIG